MENQKLLIEILESNDIITYDFLSLIPDETPLHPFVLIDGNLGIPVSLVRVLYAHALLSPSDLPSTLVLLMINPENYTAWNIRRKSATDYQKELVFNELVILKHPKRAAAWSYRSWLLSKIKLSEINVGKEVGLVLSAAALYYQNYSSFLYLRRLFTFYPAKVLMLTYIKLSNEFERICKWTEANVSDNSAWTFRAWAGRKIGIRVEQEIETAKRLIVVYRGHETLWYFLSLLVLHDQSIRRDVIGFATEIRNELEEVNGEIVDDVKQRLCADQFLKRVLRR
jgi:hypothetical protein